MNRRHNVAIVGGAAMLLATAPLTLIFAGLFTWFLPIVFAVAIVVGAGMGLRTLRAPLPVVVLGQLLGLALFLTWTSAAGGAILGIIPTGSTVGNFGNLFSDAAKAAGEQAIPVPDTPSLIFVAVLGVGLMALMVDLFAIGLRTPALAGLPMLAIYVVPMAVMENSVPWLMFVPGALGYLWLLLSDNIHRVRRFGRRFTGDGRNIDVWEPSPLATTGRWLTAIGVVIALLFPVIMPGVNTAGLLNAFGAGGNGPGDGNGPGNGAVRLDPMLNLRGSLDRDETTALAQVTTNDPNPGYLRIYVADHLTGDGISVSDPSDASFPVVDGIPAPNYSPELTGTDYAAQVTILEMVDSVIPLYANTTGVEINRAWKYDPLTGTVRSDSRNTRELSYKFTYTHYNFTPDLLRGAPLTPPGGDLFELNTAVDPIVSVDKLARQLIKDKDTTYDRVMAINDYFSGKNGFKYKLTTATGSAPTAIEDFLNNKQGFCEQYAAAMTWLVRSAGIPARSVLGFTKGTVVNNSLGLTNYNWHAWVEVYFEGFGWVPFDPTPSSNVRTAVESPWAPDPNRVDDPDPNSSGLDSGEPGKPNTGASDDPANLHDLNPNDYELGAGALDAPKPINPLPWLGGLLAALIVLSMPSLARNLRRRRRLRPSGDGTATAHLAWLELLDTLSDYDFQGAPSETPRGTADRLIERPKLTGPAAEGIGFLAGAEEHARYAATPPPTPDLVGALKAIRAELAEYTGRARRLWITVAPPSVLRSWRQNLSRSVARTVNTMSRTRNRITRGLAPRRSRHGGSA